MTRPQPEHPGGSEPVQPPAEQRLVEMCAGAFHDAGIALMAARVLAFALLDEVETHTADEFAHGLGVSTAAVSVAVRDLERLRLLQRRRAPGVRAYLYTPRVAREQVWVHLLAAQTEGLLLSHEHALSYGTRLLGRGHRVLGRLEQVGAPLARLHTDLTHLTAPGQDREPPPGE